MHGVEDGDAVHVPTRLAGGHAGDEVARGLVTAFGQLEVNVPFVVRLEGTNDEEGRRILAEAELPNVYVEKTMDGAAERVVQLAKASAAVS